MHNDPGQETVRRKIERATKTRREILTRRAEPNSTSTGEAHGHSMLYALQHAHGNAYVQRLMRSSSALLQRQAGTGAASRSVPGLPHDVVEQIQANLGSNRQAALDALTDALVGQGDVDRSFLVGETITYVTDKSRMAPGHYGHTSLSPGTGRPRPSSVDIGPDAFRSVSDLYATVMHEWQHVLQFRRPETASEPADELEARLWEVENIEQTGLWRNPGYMGRIRGDLQGWWQRLTDVEQAAFAERYQAALAIITRMTERLQEEQFQQQRGGRK